MKIYDHNLNDVIECNILDEQNLGEATLYKVEYSGVKFRVIYYPDGTYFTTDDWQGIQPKTTEDIKDFNWVDVNGKPAIILNGLPRKL